MARYSKPREYIDWVGWTGLNITKMLAACIKLHEATTEYTLRKRVEQLLPEISEKLTGQRATYQEIVQHTKETQDRIITDLKLAQRADKTLREEEFTQWWEPVVRAYREIVHPGFATTPVVMTPTSTVESTPIVKAPRCFSDADLRAAIKIYGSMCHYCKAPFSELNPPVADHYMPVAKGGATILDNCRPACVPCNSAKGDLDPFEFGMKRGIKVSGGRKGFS